MKNYIILILFFLLANNLLAQIPIGYWQDHLPYHEVKQVVEYNGNLFCRINSGIFKYDRESTELTKYNKINTLSDILVSHIAVDKNSNSLFIGYENGNIDIFRNGAKINISDIKRKDEITSKTINSVSFNDELAYISTSFGIVVLNMKTKKFVETYIIGIDETYININETIIYNDTIYAATEEGVYSADINKNLSNYNNWSKIVGKIKDNANYTAVELFDNKLYFLQPDTVFMYSDGNWTQKLAADFGITETTIKNIKQIDDKLYLISENQIYSFDKDENLIDIMEGKHSWLWYFYPNDLHLDKDENLFVATDAMGLFFMSKDKSKQQTIYPSGPFKTQISDIAEVDGVMYFAHGGYWNKTGLSKYSDNQWSIFNQYTDYATWGENFRSAYRVSINPFDNSNVFISSETHGLLEMKNNKVVNIYNGYNSILDTLSSKIEVRVGPTIVDNNQNLWITNNFSDNLVVRNSNNNWYKLNYSELNSSQHFEDFIVNKENVKWLAIRKKGLFVFDDKGTINTSADDFTASFNVEFTDENGTETTSMVYALAEDLDGAIWLGTDKGLYIYYYPEDIFTGKLEASRPIQVLDGYAEYLLMNEIITDIKVDGANRKWIATMNSGVFLVSADGTEQIYNFNKDNSPMLSNFVKAISINSVSGEVFFATEYGIISYRAEATSAKIDAFAEKIYAFPNPVRKDFNGKIGIKGLARDVNVKITDVAGNLLYETTAYGGQAIWNGKNLNNERVATGVYLVFCSNEDGELTEVTKILVVN